MKNGDVRTCTGSSSSGGTSTPLRLLNSSLAFPKYQGLSSSSCVGTCSSTPAPPAFLVSSSLLCPCPSSSSPWLSRCVDADSSIIELVSQLCSERKPWQSHTIFILVLEKTKSAFTTHGRMPETPYMQLDERKQHGKIRLAIRVHRHIIMSLRQMEVLTTPPTHQSIY